MRVAGRVKRIVGSALTIVLLIAAGGSRALSQNQPQIVWTEQEKPILEKVRTLRKLPDDQRGRTTKELALKIRQLEPGMNKLRLAVGLAHLSTEGDFGQDTLQEVATTLANALKEHPLPATPKGPPEPYVELASLVRYERVNAALDDPQYAAAMKQLEAEDIRRQEADFTLADLSGRSWTLHELRGKVVLVNFWATWCPPCRSEMPDMEALYKKFKDRGFVVLAISDDEADKVKSYIAQFHYTYPILLDAGRKVHEAFNIEGIPKSFVYDREGKLVAQSMDMRTKRQFLEMLAAAGLK
ncbi:MAG TPA: TlpA disulfide reductase family protein [Methylomirabilota bacterium]|nr:TlpA disulfide reductase family protein [Methylomirabilota bacterium]